MTHGFDSLLRGWFEAAGVVQLPGKKPTPAAGRYHRMPAASQTEVKLCVDGHHEVSADAVVFDTELGSFGLIHELTTCEQLKSSVRKWIEDAAYIRHLMGVRRSGLPEPLSEYLPTVEVVLLVDAGSEPAAQMLAGQMLAAVRDQLRELAGASGLMHAVSVNIGQYRVGDSASLDRAFSWLLPKVRAWFGKPGLEMAPAKRWTSITLENFRCEARRTWKPESGVGMHVLHGPNGSGKSSLAEAFEFVVTGQSGRLGPLVAGGKDPVAHFKPLICQRAPDRAARVTLQESDAVAQVRVVPSASDPVPAKPLVVDLPGSSFRLDQDFCDRLTTLDSTQRMRLWLETFFRRHDRDRMERLRADRTIRELLEKLLPPGTAPSALEQLSKWSGPAQTLLRGDAVTLSGFLSQGMGEMFASTMSGIRELGLSIPEVLERSLKLMEREDGSWVFHPSQQEEWIAVFREAMESDCRWVEERRSKLPEGFQEALRRLGEDSFEGLRSEGHSAQEREERFRRWTHLVARVELLESAINLASTFETFTPAKTDILSKVQPSVGVADLVAERDEAAKERDALRGVLATYTGTAEQLSQAPKRGASAADVNVLVEAVGAGVFEPEIPASQADAFKEVLERRERREFGPVLVGAPDWTRWLGERVRVLEQVAEMATPNLGKSSRSRGVGTWAQDRAESVVRLMAALVDRARLDANAASVFLEQMEKHGLGDAMVELLALMTPARWAYQPIDIQVKLGDPGDTSQERFDMRVHDLEVKQTLNTAELNTLSLVLFLLCAPRVANPYRTLFLDDPLQNMDELTVTAVARALAKLHRMWQGMDGLKEWSTVLLLHGEEDCERMLLEAPGAFYRIPWLAPVDAAELVAEPQEIKASSSHRRGGGKVGLMDFLTFVGAW